MNPLTILRNLISNPSQGVRTILQGGLVAVIIMLLGLGGLFAASGRHGAGPRGGDPKPAPTKEGNDPKATPTSAKGGGGKPVPPCPGGVLVETKFFGEGDFDGAAAYANSWPATTGNGTVQTEVTVVRGPAGQRVVIVRVWWCPGQPGMPVNPKDDKTPVPPAPPPDDHASGAEVPTIDDRFPPSPSPEPPCGSGDCGGVSSATPTPHQPDGSVATPEKEVATPTPDGSSVSPSEPNAGGSPPKTPPATPTKGQPHGDNFFDVFATVTPPAGR